MRLGLQSRYALAILPLIALLVGVFIALLLYQINRQAEDMRKSSANVLETSLFQKMENSGRALTLLLSENLINDVYLMDLVDIGDTIAATRERKDVDYIYVFDTSGRVLHDGTDENADLGRVLDDSHILSALEAAEPVVWIDNTLNVAAAIRLGPEVLGGVSVGLSLKPVHRDIAGLKAELDTLRQGHVQDYFVWSVAAALAVFVVGALVTIMLARNLSRPITTLARLTSRIGQGRYDVDIPIERSDEIGTLAESLRKMVDDLRHTTVSKAYVDNILATTLDALIVVAPDGAIQTVNPAACKLLGYGADELIGQPVEKIIAEEGIGNGAPGDLDVIEPSPAGDIESALLAKDGREIPVLISGARMRDADGNLEGIVYAARDITERKKAEREIAEKSALLETTLEQMSHGITVYDRNLDLLAFNERYVDLWDYPAGFIRLGMPFEEVARFGAQRGDYGPGDVEELVRRRVETRRRGEVYQYERVMPNGTIMAINRETMPGGGTVTTYTDITERKKAEEEIAEKSALLETTFESMSQGISVFDADLKLAAFNERYVDMWRFPEGFIRLGMPFEEIARFKAERGNYGPGDVEELIKRPIEAMRQGKHWRDKCGAPSGAVFESHRDPMPGGGVINTFTDITERKRAEAALRAREARLSELQTELLNVSRQSAMGELSSALAHELNQPLAAIMNYVQASRRMIKKTGGVVSEKAYEMMDKALDQADRAGAIVRGLREIVEKGEAARAASDINKVVEEASALGLIGAARAGIRLDLELGNELPPVNINEIQIQQVVMNLVRNGVEAMAASEKRDLTIKTALDHEDAVEIAIGDTGPGLAEEVEERLFQPFVTTKAGGMGIGLSISHSIVEAHGGRLWATPAPDGGTVFHFTLPLAPDGAEDNDE